MDEGVTPVVRTGMVVGAESMLALVSSFLADKQAAQSSSPILAHQTAKKKVVDRVIGTTPKSSASAASTTGMLMPGA